MTPNELLVEQLNDTRDWTNKLLADFDDNDWFHQPLPGMAHPLWLCGHLATSQDALIHQRCLGNSVVTPDFKQHFPIGQPVKPATEHNYPTPNQVLEVFADVHAKSIQAVQSMPQDLLNEPAFSADGKSPHPHYRNKRGAVSHAIRHEAFHAGQLATIRRLLGKPFLR